MPLRSNPGPGWPTRRRLAVVGSVAVAAIALGAVVATNHRDGGPIASQVLAATPAADSADEGAELGEPARDGDFEFTVTAMECGAGTVGTEELHKDADGQFCLVDVTVENLGDETHLFFHEVQKVYDADGNQYAADTEASLYLAESTAVLSEVRAGRRADATVVFDVPEAVTPTVVELSHTLSSGGVRIALPDQP